MIILAVITIYVYLPVFYNLHLTSTYEYLGRRFDDKTRKCASFLFALALLVYLPIVIYIPALAFSAGKNIVNYVIININIIITASIIKIKKHYIFHQKYLF